MRVEPSNIWGPIGSPSLGARGGVACALLYDKTVSGSARGACWPLRSVSQTLEAGASKTQVAVGTKNRKWLALVNGNMD